MSDELAKQLILEIRRLRYTIHYVNTKSLDHTDILEDFGQIDIIVNDSAS